MQLVQLWAILFRHAWILRRRVVRSQQVFIITHEIKIPRKSLLGIEYLRDLFQFKLALLCVRCTVLSLPADPPMLPCTFGRASDR